MAQSILVVDFGNYETTAALVTEGRIEPVTCPPAWTSHLDTHYLKTVVAMASARVDRLVLTIPTSFGRDEGRREAVVAMAAEAGFADVELISDAIAALLDPFLENELSGMADERAARKLVLVCDLGVSWSTTLVRVDREQPVQLAEETGADSLTRGGADILTESALRWLVASCRAVVARANAQLADLGAVILVGGGGALPAAARVLQAELGRPVHVPGDPVFAVIRGAAKWASQATNGRAIKAAPATWRVEPLIWAVPERSRLVRWLVAEGQTFEHGTCLAQVRTPDDRVYDLTAARDGIMIEHRAHPGGTVGSSTIAAMARSAVLITGDRPTKHLELKVSGEWMLTGDRKQLVECADSGAYVRVRSIGSGAVVQEVCPATARQRPQHGRVFVDPDGQLALVCWDDAGQFAVWAVPSGRLVTQFHATARPLSVSVHEGQWHLVSELDRKVSVGRYRRDVARIWDLRTGSMLDEVHGDDLARRFTGFVQSSAQHGFAAEVCSPDGRLRAGSSRVDGHAAVWLHQADTDEELFRADLQTERPVRSAFSADGHYLLNRWWSAGAACVDIWRI